MNERVSPTLLGVKRDSQGLFLVVMGVADLVLTVASWWLIVDLVAPDFPRGTDILVLLSLAMVVAQLAYGALTGLYLRRYLIGSAGELRGQLLMAAVSLVLVVGVTLIAGRPRVLLVTLAAWAGAVLLQLASRRFARMYLDAQRRPRSGAPVVVVGADLLGTTLADQMLRDQHSAYLPVAFVDDSRAKRRASFSGVPVAGTTDQLGDVIRATGAQGAVVAVEDPEPALYARLADQVEGTGAWVRTVPTTTELLGGPAGVGSLREVDVSDLIGRDTAAPDLDAAWDLIRGRRVLVTGAGGSIGSELCRQLHRLEPAELIMLDRDESALHELQLSLSGRALLDTPDVVLADIREAAVVDAIFAERRPEVVFHAAALKHLPLLQSYPQEGWKTNVHGSQNVIAAAVRHGVTRFVNVSTDKAASPTSVLGTTKRIAEGLTSAAAERTGRPYVSVRFGNVIGSRGSAIPAFAKQIRGGGPVTVTDPEVSRFFMTIPEACALVLFAITVGRPGETLVLEMGQPLKIVDVVRRMMVLMGRSCEIVYTGLRHGEKLHEDLFTPAESEVVDRHDRVYHVHTEGIDACELPAPTADEAHIEAYTMLALSNAMSGRK